jgi:2-polyprenyl-3-methyl-5-hydroxy-6-metoxy-1,4-benzoquinol methylase
MWHSIKHLKHDVIIDVGGNDGSLLKSFRSQTKDPLTLINVDASSSFREENIESGIDYVNDYFNEDLDLPTADIITSTNVFQHTSDVEKFLSAIKKHLGGVWIL